MEQKLQELTERIYSEGIEKARQQAEAILSEARQQAEEIQNKALREADKIRESVGREVEEFKDNATAELGLSLRQAIRSLEQQITDLVSGRLLDIPLEAAFQDYEFITQLIQTAVKNWKPQEMVNPELSLLLPAKDQEQLDQFLKSRLKEMLDGGMQVTFGGNLENGFRIGPSDGGYVITFTQDDFRLFLQDYLRPRIKELLFKEL